jgi:prepilin-type N-terminal cleavage/methylation domain-containing protein
MKTNTTLKSKFNSAFSLVELLVVIAVIAVIAAVAIPNVVGVRDAAQAANTSDIEGQMAKKSRELRALGFDNAALDTPEAWVAVLEANTTIPVAGQDVSIGIDIPEGYQPSGNLSVAGSGATSYLTLEAAAAPAP